MPDPSSALPNIADEFISRPAKNQSRKIAIIEPKGGLTYEALESEMNRVAQALRHSNCQAKDRVLIAL
ncbi:MAG: hypothetical protein WA197_16725, partial [Candidatus Acidiferrales bacterium]